MIYTTKQKVLIIVAPVFIIILIALFLFVRNQKNNQSTNPRINSSPGIAYNYPSPVPSIPLGQITFIGKVISKESTGKQLILKIQPYFDPKLYRMPDPRIFKTYDPDLAAIFDQPEIMITVSAKAVYPAAFPALPVNIVNVGSWVRVVAPSSLNGNTRNIQALSLYTLNAKGQLPSVGTVVIDRHSPKFIEVNATGAYPDTTTAFPGEQINFVNIDKNTLDVFLNGKKTGQLLPQTIMIISQQGNPSTNTLVFQFLAQGATLENAPKVIIHIISQQ